MHQAKVKIEGWATYGDHRYVPIGGILAIVKANARANIKASAQFTNDVAEAESPKMTVTV